VWKQKMMNEEQLGSLDGGGDNDLGVTMTSPVVINACVRSVSEKGEGGRRESGVWLRCGGKEEREWKLLDCSPEISILIIKHH